NSLKDKDLMLQEMKHRIKNSIARILAIARQTSNSAESVGEFLSSFTARLQAMAAAQDMLTRSQWGRADLEQLLTTELCQVFGELQPAHTVGGPTVDLDEKAVQALGLTFHELATSALKYGDMAHEDAELLVTWSLS